MVDENKNGIPDELEKLAKSLWKSKTMWLSSLLGLTMVIEEYSDFLPEQVVHYAGAASAVLIMVFRAKAHGTVVKAKKKLSTPAEPETKPEE